VHHAGNHLRRIFHRLAAAELSVTGIQVDGRATQLMHAGFKRQARAGRLLLENHRKGAILERPVAFVSLESGLDPARACEEVVVLLARIVFELQIMSGRFHAASPARNCRISWLSTSTMCATSASLMMSGGNSRTTLSDVTLISSPAS